MYEIRIYYNNSSEYPYIWSYDNGDISTERKTKAIHIHKCNLVSKFEKTADNTKNPKAFLVVTCERAVMINDETYFS